MTATPLIKDQSVVAFPVLDAVKADARTVGDTANFAAIFAAISVLELRGPDRRGETPADWPLVPATGVKKAVGGDLLTDDVALFAEMMNRTKDNLIVSEVGDPSGIPQAADVAILGGPEGYLAVLRLIGDPGATDIAIDLDQVAASLARLLKGELSEADVGLPGAAAEGVLLEADVLLQADVPPEAADAVVTAASIDMALMQVDGRLAIVFAGPPGYVSNELVTNANIIEPMVLAPQQTTGQTAPPMPAEGELVALALMAPPAVTAATTGIPSEGGPQMVREHMSSAAVLPVVPFEKPSSPVVPPSVSGSQKIDDLVSGIVDNLTIRPGALSAMAVSDDPVISISALVSGEKVAGPHPDALRDGITVQPMPPEAGPKPGAALASLSGPQAWPLDQNAVQAASVVATTNRDLMYRDITSPHVGSAAPLVAGATIKLVAEATIKTGRLRSSEQADGQQSEQRSGLVPQPLAGTEILGARTADQAHASVMRIARGDASMNAVQDQKLVPTQEHRGTGQVISDMGGPPAAQSGTQTSAGATSATAAVPMAQSNGLPAMLDVRRQGWTQTLVQRAAGMVQSGGVLTLKILPQHLGQITLKMSEGRRGLDLRIVTEVASTAAMLRGVESQIASAFEGAGLMLGEFSANTGKDGGTDFGDDRGDSDPTSARATDAEETDAGMISDDTAQHRLLNIIL